MVGEINKQIISILGLEVSEETTKILDTILEAKKPDTSKQLLIEFLKQYYNKTDHSDERILEE